MNFKKLCNLFAAAALITTSVSGMTAYADNSAMYRGAEPMDATSFIVEKTSSGDVLFDNAFEATVYNYADGELGVVVSNLYDYNNSITNCDNIWLNCIVYDEEKVRLMYYFDEGQCVPDKNGNVSNGRPFSDEGIDRNGWKIHHMYVRSTVSGLSKGTVWNLTLALNDPSEEADVWICGQKFHMQDITNVHNIKFSNGEPLFTKPAPETAPAETTTTVQTNSSTPSPYLTVTSKATETAPVAPATLPSETTAMQTTAAETAPVKPATLPETTSETTAKPAETTKTSTTSTTATETTAAETEPATEAPTPDEEPDYSMFDINKDGKVDWADVFALMIFIK